MNKKTRVIWRFLQDIIHIDDKRRKVNTFFSESHWAASINPDTIGVLTDLVYLDSRFSESKLIICILLLCEVVQVGT